MIILGENIPKSIRPFRFFNRLQDDFFALLANFYLIALILGLTALINPIAVHSQVLRKELLILTAVTALCVFQLWDNQVSRGDALVLLAVFGLLMAWTSRLGMQKKPDTLGTEMAYELEGYAMPAGPAIFWLVLGLILLIVSSRVLVWGGGSNRPRLWGQ